MKLNSKLIYLAVLCTVTVALSVYFYRLGSTYSIHRQAETLLANRISELEYEYNNKKARISQLNEDKQLIIDDIESKASVNKEIEQNMKTIRDTTQNIQSAKESIATLESQIEEKEKMLANAENISAAGRELILSEGIYDCPEDVLAGRYTISGDLLLLLYSSDNTLKISQDLSRLNVNSFTFTVSEGERIKIDMN